MSDSIPALRVVPPLRESEDDDGLPLRPADELIAEMNALNATGRAIEGKGSLAEARRLVRAALDRRHVEDGDVQDLGIVAAMAKIVGDEPILVAKPSNDSEWSEAVLQGVLHAWTSLTIGRKEVAFDVLPRLRARQHEEEGAGHNRTGAVNLMALYYWLSAVEALAHGDLTESRRLWNRALEIGSTWGTDTHLVISWTYVASFV